LNLRALSSVAPLGDLQAGICVMLLAVSIAHVAIVPRLCADSPRTTGGFLLCSALGLVAVVTALMTLPRAFYAASVVYVAAFAVAASIASNASAARFALRKRILLSVAVMLASIAVASWMAFAPR
jgi:hypothetical protein